jgi:hypothetical protein
MILGWQYEVEGHWVTEGSFQDGDPFCFRSNSSDEKRTDAAHYLNASGCRDAFRVIGLHVFAHVHVMCSYRRWLANVAWKLLISHRASRNVTGNARRRYLSKVTCLCVHLSLSGRELVLNEHHYRLRGERGGAGRGQSELEQRWNVATFVGHLWQWVR